MSRVGSKVLTLPAVTGLVGVLCMIMPAVVNAADEFLLSPVSSTSVTVARDQTYHWLSFDRAPGVAVNDLRVSVVHLEHGDTGLPTEGVSAVIVPLDRPQPVDLSCPALDEGQRRFDMICVGFPPLDEDGSYVLRLTVQGVSPTTGGPVLQNLDLTLVRRAAVLKTSLPAVFIRNQATPFGPDLLPHAPFSLRLDEVGRYSPMTSIIITQDGEAKVGTTAITGTLTVQPPQTVVQASYAHAGVEFEGEWPPGDATVNLIVSAPELAADIRVPVVVETRVSPLWMLGAALLGVIVGALLRGVAQNRLIDLRQGTPAEKSRRLLAFVLRTAALLLLFEVLVFSLYGGTWTGTVNELAVIFLWAVTVDFTAQGLLGLAKKPAGG